jgi:low temperature requirement protein LtrA
MRLALVFQWLRAARQDPARRETCLRCAKYLAPVQLGWITVLLIEADLLTTFLMTACLIALEMATPFTAERKLTTPWHAHHIAERYGLLAIIALGECLTGAIETLRAIVASHGWSVDATLVGFGGTALVFGMWWIYFMLPASGHCTFAGIGHISSATATSPFMWPSQPRAQGFMWRPTILTTRHTSAAQSPLPASPFQSRFSRLPLPGSTPQ